MKKTFAMLLALTMCLSLSACNKKAVVEDATENATESVVEAPTEKEKTAEFTPVSTGEKIATDFVEITVGNVESGQSLTKGTISYSPASEKNHYLWLSAMLKNLTGDAFHLAQGMYALITFDDKYNYEADLKCFEGYDMDPLIEYDIYMSAEIPAELAESYEKVTVKFGFNDNFTEYDYDKYDYKKKVENFDNIYVFTHTKDNSASVDAE